MIIGSVIYFNIIKIYIYIFTNLIIAGIIFLITILK